MLKFDLRSVDMWSQLSLGINAFYLQHMWVLCTPLMFFLIRLVLWTLCLCVWSTSTKVLLKPRLTDQALNWFVLIRTDKSRPPYLHDTPSSNTPLSAKQRGMLATCHELLIIKIAPFQQHAHSSISASISESLMRMSRAGREVMIVNATFVQLSVISLSDECC